MLDKTWQRNLIESCKDQVRQIFDPTNQNIDKMNTVLLLQQNNSICAHNEKFTLLYCNIVLSRKSQ